MPFKPSQTSPESAGGIAGRMRPSAGASMIEVMIAMTIGLVILGAMVQLITGSSKNIRLMNNENLILNNGRFAVLALEEEVRNAGYQGCRSFGRTPPVVRALAPLPMISDNNALLGYEGGTSGWSPTLVTELSALAAGSNTALPKIKTQSDVLTVQAAQNCAGSLLSPAAVTGSVVITSANECGIAAGDVMIIADCLHSDVFRASGVFTNAGTTTLTHLADQNSSVSFSRPYSTDAEVLRLRAYSYFIGSVNGGEPGLWRYDHSRTTSSASGTENPALLLDGIEDLQLSFGSDGNADQSVDQYQTAGNVTSWPSIVRVQIDLLFRSSDDRVLAQAQTYSFNGAAATASDLRMRRAFSTSVAVRNRLQ